MRLNEFEFKIKELLGEGLYEIEFDEADSSGRCSCDDDHSIIIRTKIYQREDKELIVGDIHEDEDTGELVVGEDKDPIEEAPLFKFK